MAGSNQVKAPDPGHCGPAGAPPEAVNCSLTEGYLGDTIVTPQRRELVIEEGGPVLSLSLPLSCPGAPKGWNNIGLGETLGDRVLPRRVHLHSAFARYKYSLSSLCTFRGCIPQLRNLGSAICRTV